MGATYAHVPSLLPSNHTAPAECYLLLGLTLPSTFAIAKPKQTHSPVCPLYAASVLVKKILCTSPDTMDSTLQCTFPRQDTLLLVFCSHGCQPANQMPEHVFVVQAIKTMLVVAHNGLPSVLLDTYLLIHL